ncbi:MAG: DUF1059 domain-containing protein [Propionibacteriaceae bacterium]
MIFKLVCGDVLPGCPAYFATTEHDHLLAQVAEHARSVHGITDFTPEVRQAVEDKIARTDPEPQL